MNLLKAFHNVRHKIYEKRICKIFDKRSSVFDQLEWIRDPALLDEIYRFIQPEPDESLLDVGTGTGALLCYLGQFVKEAYGIDISKKMVERAKKNTQIYQQELGANCHLHVSRSSVDDLNFTDNSFNIITCRNALHHFNGIQRSLAEMKRVLKPTGRVIIMEGIALGSEELPLWKEILKIKDPGRNKRFYSLSKDNYMDFFEKSQTALFKKKGVQLRLERTAIVQINRSVKNWLAGGALSLRKRKKVIQKLRKAPSLFKERYGIRFTKDDVIMKYPLLILEAKKGSP